MPVLKPKSGSGGWEQQADRLAYVHTSLVAAVLPSMQAGLIRRWMSAVPDVASDRAVVAAGAAALLISIVAWGH